MDARGLGGAGHPARRTRLARGRRDTRRLGGRGIPGPVLQGHRGLCGGTSEERGAVPSGPRTPGASAIERRREGATRSPGAFVLYGGGPLDRESAVRARVVRGA